MLQGFFINYTWDTGLCLVFFNCFLKVNSHPQVSSLRIHCILYENYEESFTAQGTVGFTATTHDWKQNFKGMFGTQHTTEIEMAEIAWLCIRNQNPSWLSQSCGRAGPWKNSNCKLHIFAMQQSEINVSMTLGNYFHMNSFRLRINF